MYKLFIHQLKEKLRSSFWKKSIFFNIILGILALYIASFFIVIGLFADIIIIQTYKSHDVIRIFTGLLFYYFSFDLIFRFLFQQLPVISIKPYLTLPIKKSRLLHYPILRSLSSFFNIIPLLLFLPFFFKHICITQSFQFNLIWIVTVLSMIAINNFLNFSLKKYFSKKPLRTLLILLCFASFICLDLSKTFSFSKYFSGFVYYTSANFYIILIPIALVAFTYYLAYNFLKRNSYIEDSQNKTIKKSWAFDFLEKYGEIGQLMRIEMKLVFRNKRPKSLLYISAFFALYGLMFYTKQNLDKNFTLILMGLLLPSMFSFNYGQFLFSWESSYFDRILVSRIKPYNYIKAKHLFLAFACTIGFIVILPYGLIDYKIIFINSAFLLFNIGITSIILMFFCTFNSSYIDLGKSQVMNYQGTSFTQFLIMIPVIAIPFLIYLLFKLTEGLQYYYYTIAIIGFAGIIMNKFLLQLIVRRFLTRKYKMSMGFRQK